MCFFGLLVYIFFFDLLFVVKCVWQHLQIWFHVYNWDWIPLPKTSCTVARYHTPDLCACVQMLPWSPPIPPPPPLFLCNPSSSSSIVAERILLSFTHSLPLSSISLTFLITHTPLCGPSLTAFEVILAQILLSCTADKTRKGLQLRASGNVCLSVDWITSVSCFICVYIWVNVYTRETSRTDFQGV